MERTEFAAEGLMEIGPKEHYFVFLDGAFFRATAGEPLPSSRRARLYPAGSRECQRGALGREG